MKKFILSVFMCLMLMSISSFAQDGDGWQSSYTKVVISESNPRCVLMVNYTWRKNESGQKEIFIYHKYLTSDSEDGCVDKYLYHENMFNDIIIAKIIFDLKRFGTPDMEDCAKKEYLDNYIIYTSSCQTEEKTTTIQNGRFEYHFKACNSEGNCKSLYQYCWRYDYKLSRMVIYCKKTIIDGASAICPGSIKNEETGTEWQCHPKDCFPFAEYYEDFNSIPTTDDIGQYDDNGFFNGGRPRL